MTEEVRALAYTQKVITADYGRDATGRRFEAHDSTLLRIVDYLSTHVH